MMTVELYTSTALKLGLCNSAAQLVNLWLYDNILLSSTHTSCTTILISRAFLPQIIRELNNLHEYINSLAIVIIIAYD